MSEKTERPKKVLLSLVGGDALPSEAEVSAIMFHSKPHRLGAVETVLQQRYPSRSWRLTKIREVRKSRISVGLADDTQIALDADAWIKQQANESSNRDAVAEVLRRDNIIFSRSENQIVYVIGTDPVAPLDFIQIRFCVETKLSLPAVALEPWHLCEYGGSESFPWKEAKRSGPSLQSEPKGVVHSLPWLEHCNAAHKIKCQQEMTRLKGTFVQQHLRSGGLGAPVPLLEFEPGLAQHINRPSHEERWFSDWISSSAGSLPMGQHWFLETHDHTDKEGTRHVGFIPRALAWPANKVSAKGKSRFQLMDRLTRFDLCVQHPFGWYFHMVYGNRVPVYVGEIVAEGIKRGQICLPKCDEAVLMAWIANPYRF